MVGKIGENIVVRRWAHLEAKNQFGLVHAYVHMGGKLAVLVEADAPNAAARDEPGLHDVRGQRRDADRRDEPARRPPRRDREGASSTSSARSSRRSSRRSRTPSKEKQKPEAMWGKIIDGKVSKWLDEVTLLGQDYVVTDPGKTVESVRKESRQEGRRRGEAPLVPPLRARRGHREEDGRPRGGSREDDRRRTADAEPRRARALCAISVDLDEIPNYFAIHGLEPSRAASTAVYDVAIDRLESFADAARVPLTLFAVGSDLARARRRRSASRPRTGTGTRSATTRSTTATTSCASGAPDPRAGRARGARHRARATGERPVGFRAPGYTITDEVFGVLPELGVALRLVGLPVPRVLGREGGGDRRDRAPRAQEPVDRRHARRAPRADAPVLRGHAVLDARRPGSSSSRSRSRAARACRSSARPSPWPARRARACSRGCASASRS